MNELEKIEIVINKNTKEVMAFNALSKIESFCFDLKQQDSLNQINLVDVICFMNGWGHLRPGESMRIHYGELQYDITRSL